MRARGKTTIRILLLAALLLPAASGISHGFTREPVTARQGMVVTSQHLATDVGVQILKDGGNAADAAVAVGYALAVTNPCCGNLGGGGFATLHLADGRDVFFNFRERAPLAASRDMYLDAEGKVIPGKSLKGFLAVGVPGTVLGLETLRLQHGSMSRQALMAPAIRLAEEGFILTEGDADILNAAAKDLSSEANVAAIFTKQGSSWKAGDRLIQKDLGRTLRLIMEKGPDAFYKGPIAEAVVAASSSSGGILSREDFAQYTAEVGKPLSCSYRGYLIVSAPPPSSGGATICLILNILEGYPVRQFGYQSATNVQLMVEAMRHAFVDRNFLLGDPDFVNNPIDRLLSDDYAEKIRSAIRFGEATRSDTLAQGKPPHEGTETTHYSVIDAKGNAIAVTYTINALFGAKVIAGDTGFLLNDEMDDFTLKAGAPNLFGLIQGNNNEIAPGKRPLSSMSPTIILKDGKPFMVVGSPGGSRIITIVVQVIMNVIDHGMTIQEAVNAPRIHHQWLPDQVSVEPFALSPDTAKLLRDMGYKIVEQTPWGAAEAILIGAPEEQGVASSGNDSIAASSASIGIFQGGHDDRRPAGSAAGPDSIQ